MALFSKQQALFDNRGNVADWLQGVLSDVALTHRFRTLTDYFAAEKITGDPAEKPRLIAMAEGQVEAAIREISFMQYRYAELAGDWGDPGEFQVRSSFCRGVLQIPSDREISGQDWQTFYEWITAAYTDTNIADWSANQFKTAITRFQIRVLGRVFPYREMNRIGTFLQFLGSKKKVMVLSHNGQTLFVLAEGKTKVLNGFDVILMEKELFRSPHVTIPLAAFIEERQIFLRRASFESIFYIKWVPSIEPETIKKSWLQHDIPRNISEGIKAQVFRHYGWHSRSQLVQSKDRFLADSMETVMYHELGHGAVNRDTIDLEVFAIIEGAHYFGDRILEAIAEFLADFSPKIGANKGPIQNIIDLSKKDPKRATAMYYMYFSDTWFFDTPDTYMYRYSDMMALVLSRFVRPDLSVDFERLERALVFRPAEQRMGAPTLFEVMVDFCVATVKTARQEFEKLPFEVNGNPYSFFAVSNMTQDNIKKEGYQVNWGSYRFVLRYWACMWLYAKQFAKDNAALAAVLSEAEKKLFRQLLAYSGGKAALSRYDGRHRDFVFDRLMRVGVCAVKPKDWKPAIQTVS
jgi:hypothetical protein